MSLLLRKACQPILDKLGLQNYHAEITTTTPKYLSIVGECGKSLIEIHGITFSKNVPTLAEREYAVELLNAFLVKYKGKIASYLTRKKANGTIPTHKEYSLYFNYGDTEVSYTDGIATIFVIIKNKKNATPDTSLKFRNTHISLQSISDFKHNSIKHKKAIYFAEEAHKWNAENHAIQNLQDNLSVCNI